MGSQHKAALAASSKTRVQGVTAPTAVKASAGILWGVLVSNADAAVQTLTLTLDGAAVNVIRQAPGTSQMYRFDGVTFSTSLAVTPSTATVDALVIFD